MSEEHTKRNSQTTAVEIYGHTYNIRSEGGSEHILNLAKFLDERMREISAQTLIGESVKIAILAALKFTDELHRLKGLYKEQERKIDSMISDCSEVLDQALCSGTTGAEQPLTCETPSIERPLPEGPVPRLNCAAPSRSKKRVAEKIGQPFLLPIDDRVHI